MTPDPVAAEEVPPAPSADRTATGGAPSDAAPRSRLREWGEAAVVPRTLVVLLLLVVVAGACVRLGAWQLDRAALRGAAEAQESHAQRLAAEPVPISEVLPAQQSLPVDAVGRPVTAVGSFDGDQQLLVPDRAVDGSPAVLVVTAFRVTEGPDAGALLPVVRGWVGPDAVSTAEGAVEPVDERAAAALAVPAGQTQITGYLQGSEATGAGDDLPEGMVGSVSAGQLANVWGGPSWAGYLVLAEGAAGAAPADGRAGLSPVPPPSVPGETGLNLQNLAYAVEWWIFGLFALLLGWRMLRDEVRHRRADAQDGSG
ncbi:SURF1 family protein [Georgenia sp. 10Sc9-8]|uniref:SURF1-like protein n=1 Tax=Georgenia halotolerans TaxID=3028317 RepID=A0ABT5TYP5_9MICO|nr:SURF1 family protein [Georgenia halotolerans]